MDPDLVAFLWKHFGDVNLPRSQRSLAPKAALSGTRSFGRGQRRLRAVAGARSGVLPSRSRLVAEPKPRHSLSRFSVGREAFLQGDRAGCFRPPTSCSEHRDADSALVLFTLEMSEPTDASTMPDSWLG